MRNADDDGHVAGFTIAFQDLYPRAVRLARRILGDRAAAEDVAAEAMARAYSHWDRIGGSASHRTGWVLRVTTNLAVDTTRRRESPADMSSLEHSGRVADVTEVTDDRDVLADRITLTEALRALPRRQREAVALRYLAGLRQAEVADALGVSTGTVSRHVNRGLARLHDRLRDQLDAPAAPGAPASPATEGGRMKIESWQEAVPFAGTDQVVVARVTGRLSAVLWSVDIGIPAVMLWRGDPEDEGDGSSLVGREIECVVVEVDAAKERVLTAPAGATEETAELWRRREMVAGLRVGEVRPGRVHALVPFGAFVDVGDLHGLVHVSELGEPGTDPQDVLRVGQDVQVEVLDKDVELQRVSLRLR